MERYEELAHHFTLGHTWAKAFDYLAKSGDKARQAYANQEAIAFYTQALEVSQRITPALEGEQLIPVYEGRGLVWLLLHHIDEAITDFHMMLQLAHVCGNRQKEGESLCHLTRAHYQKMSGDHLLFVEQYAQEALQLAQHTGDPHILAMSLISLGHVERGRGNLREADHTLEQSLHISCREGFQDAVIQALTLLGSHAYWQGHCPCAVHLCQEGATRACELHNGFYDLLDLSDLCLAHWSSGNYVQVLSVLDEGMTKAQEWKNLFFVGRLTHTLGWFWRECYSVAQALVYDHESLELGRTSRLPNVEGSALINLGLDYLALAQPGRALSYLEPTLERVEREAFGTHRWRWKVRLLIGLAELSSMTGDYNQAVRHVEEGLQEAQRTSSQKYVALGWVWRGKIAAKLGDSVSAGTELQQAFSLAEQLQSPSLLYPIAYDLGHWYETTGNEREAASLYGKAKATIVQMATAIEDEALRSTFLQSALVQEMHERATRLSG